MIAPHQDLPRPCIPRLAPAASSPHTPPAPHAMFQPPGLCQPLVLITLPSHLEASLTHSGMLPVPLSAWMPLAPHRSHFHHHFLGKAFPDCSARSDVRPLEPQANPWATPADTAPLQFTPDRCMLWLVAPKGTDSVSFY